MEWMLMPLRRYADFQGRSRRKEYWMFTLFIILVYLALVALGFAIVGTAALGLAGAATPAAFAGLGAGAILIFGLFGLFVLAIIIPSFAVGARRLHDVGRSGWWIVAPTVVSLASLAVGGTGIDIALSFASLIGSFVLFVFLCLPGTRGPNRFGADPKDPAGDLAQVFS